MFLIGVPAALATAFYIIQRYCRKTRVVRIMQVV